MTNDEAIELLSEISTGEAISENYSDASFEKFSHAAKLAIAALREVEQARATPAAKTIIQFSSQARFFVWAWDASDIIMFDGNETAVCDCGETWTLETVLTDDWIELVQKPQPAATPLPQQDAAPFLDQRSEQQILEDRCKSLGIPKELLLPAATPAESLGVKITMDSFRKRQAELAATPAAGAEEPTGETWYSDHELDTLLTKAGITGHGLRTFICEHIRLAFNKGKQIGNARLTAELAATKKHFEEVMGYKSTHYRVADLLAERDAARAELAALKPEHEALRSFIGFKSTGYTCKNLLAERDEARRELAAAKDEIERLEADAEEMRDQAIERNDE